jgi:hypothetical protein
MSSTNPDSTLTSAEVEHLDRLEAIVQRGVDADLQLGNALAEISDASLYRGTHQTFEAYLRDRWGISRAPDNQLIQAAELADPSSTEIDLPAPATEPEERPLAPVRGEGPEAVANLWEQAFQELSDDEVIVVEVRLTLHRRELVAGLNPARWPIPWRPGELEVGKLVSWLGWLLTYSNGTIADVAHHLETRAVDLEDDAREQLRDDVLALDEELATVKALLAPVDWDAEHGRLLAGEIPPFEGDADDEQDG